MSDITLKLDERNDIRFDVSITSSEHSSEGPNVQSRFICENGEFEFAFPATITEDGGLQVIVPAMSNLISEGVYHTRLEVIVDGKHFVPLELKTKFAQSTKVVAEGVRVMGTKQDVVTEPIVRVNVAPKVVKLQPQAQKANTIVEKKMQQEPKKQGVKNNLDTLDKLIKQI
jgi:hypothetical protein